MHAGIYACTYIHMHAYKHANIYTVTHRLQLYIYIYICANHNCIVYCIFVLLNANIVDRTQQMEQISN